MENASTLRCDLLLRYPLHREIGGFKLIVIPRKNTFYLRAIKYGVLTNHMHTQLAPLFVGLTTQLLRGKGRMCTPDLSRWKVFHCSLG